MDEHNEQLTQCLADTFLDQIQLDGNVLSEALSLDGEAITTLPDRQLSAMVYNLSRYQVYIQLHANVRTANLLTAKRIYESELNVALVSLKAPAKATVKEKLALAFDQNPKLKNLDESVAIAEREEALFKKVPEQTVHLVNSLKKEMGRREGNS